ncbi:unnamed protein product, partial [Musa hybrid cultivar]
VIEESVRKEGLNRFWITPSQHAVRLSQRIGGTDVSENKAHMSTCRVKI